MLPRVLTRQQVRAVDQRAIDDFGMLGLVLMENAGRGAADCLEQAGIDGTVVVCCGKGNNGGDGLVLARHLDFRGHAVEILLAVPPEQLQGDAAANLTTILAAEISCRYLLPSEWEDAIQQADWIVDGLLGTGARGNPRAPLDQILKTLNGHSARKLALDLPSGLDCDTGEVAESTFRADLTCTFVASKPGLHAPAAAPWVGQIEVVDIGVPRRLLEQLMAEPG